MSDLWKQAKDALSTIAGSWASYIAIGSFCLYVLGYLSLRFHLTALGVGTDLAVIDERYFYAGAKFLVYLALTFPIIILLVMLLLLVLSVPALVAYLVYELISKLRSSDSEKKSLSEKLIEWSTNPTLVAVVGILLSELLIQFVMRQCLSFSNLLVASDIPDYWTRPLFLDETLQQFFFSGLVAGTGLSTALLLRAWSQQRRLTGAINASLKFRRVTRFLIIVQALLVTTQFLLLAVNHGVFIADKVVPKVKDLGAVESLQSCETAAGTQPVKVCQEAWMIWDGADGVTYLVQHRERQENAEERKTRALITLSKKDIKRTEIIRYDQILDTLFRKP